eukprot:CAMPEP_0179073298 /NCGR_PEP_ID=MMETSP0796-20121207/32499_1 /TAXON_ID=73915 /ORGANISM="Pyrodinium bahamense, Strain pbaha01" /LENGTH=336 /DNA_ID=CAMNT_0020770487 /DNA_START=62 /DNA_END=1072 /DNA_ORIENTATION=+
MAPCAVRRHGFTCKLAGSGLFSCRFLAALRYFVFGVVFALPFHVYLRDNLRQTVASCLGDPLRSGTLRVTHGQPAFYQRRAAIVSLSVIAISLPHDAAWGDGPNAEEMTFDLQLPSRSWKVKTELRQAIRVRKEKVFDASDTSSKASVIVTRTPLGAGRSESEMREEIMELAGAFDEKRQKDMTKEDIVKILTQAFDNAPARRDRQWVSVSRLPGTDEYLGPGGQRYVRFAYDTEECTGKVSQFKRYDGSSIEDCDGRVLPRRRHFVTATVMPTKYTSMRSSYLDGSSGSRSRLIESLWLLDASAPAAQAEQGLSGDLEKIARSFSVALPAFDPED